MFGYLQIWAASRLRLLLNACLMLSSPPKGDKSQVVAHPPTHKRFRARNWSSQIIDMVENRLFWWWSLNVIDGDDKLFQISKWDKILALGPLLFPFEWWSRNSRVFPTVKQDKDPSYFQRYFPFSQNISNSTMLQKLQVWVYPNDPNQHCRL